MHHVDDRHAERQRAGVERGDRRVGEQDVGAIALDDLVEAPQLSDAAVHALREQALHAVRDQLGLQRGEIGLRRRQRRDADRLAAALLMYRKILRQHLGARQTRGQNQVKYAHHASLTIRKSIQPAADPSPTVIAQAMPVTPQKCVATGTRHAQHDRLDDRGVRRDLRHADGTQPRHQHRDHRADRHVDHEDPEERHGGQPRWPEHEFEERLRGEPQHDHEHRETHHREREITPEHPLRSVHVAPMVLGKRGKQILRHRDGRVGEQHLRELRRHLVRTELKRPEQLGDDHLVELIQQEIDHAARPDPAAEVDIVPDAGEREPDRRARRHRGPGERGLEQFGREQADQHGVRARSAECADKADRAVHERRRGLDAGELLETALARDDEISRRRDAAKNRQKRREQQQSDRAAEMKLAAHERRERGDQQADQHAARGRASSRPRRVRRDVGVSRPCTTACARPVSESDSAIATASSAMLTAPIASGPRIRPMARNLTATNPRTTTCCSSTQNAAS